MFGARRPGSSLSVMVGMMERKSYSMQTLTQGNLLDIMDCCMVYAITALVVSSGYNNVLMGLGVHLGLLLYGGWTCVYGIVLL